MTSRSTVGISALAALARNLPYRLTPPRKIAPPVMAPNFRNSRLSIVQSSFLRKISHLTYANLALLSHKYSGDFRVKSFVDAVFLQMVPDFHVQSSTKKPRWEQPSPGDGVRAKM